MITAKGTETFAAHYVMYLHDFFLEDSVASVAPFVDRILIARTLTPWFGPPADLRRTESALARVKSRYGDKVEIHSGNFPDEHTQRNFLLDVSRERGHRGAFIIDCDEIFLEGAFPALDAHIRDFAPQAIKAPYYAFIRYADVCVAPPYETGLFYVDLTRGARFTWARACSVEPSLLPRANPLIAHFSYIREHDDDILAKIRSFMHSGDTDWDLWFDKYYRSFDIRMRDFHPVVPTGWRHLQPFDTRSLPQGVRDKLAAAGKLSGLPRDFPAPHPPQELHDRALRLVAENRPEAAVVALTGLLRAYPSYTPARNDLALLYYDAGDRANALRQLELSSEQAPGNGTVLTNLASLHCQQGEIDKAMECCRKIIAHNPRNAEALVNLANLNRIVGREDAARSFYAQALAVDPHNQAASRGIGALASCHQA